VQFVINGCAKEKTWLIFSRQYITVTWLIKSLEYSVHHMLSYTLRSSQFTGHLSVGITQHIVQ